MTKAWSCWLLGIAACAVFASAQPVSPSTDGALLPRDSVEAAEFRGSVVFGQYCVTCHGINADGKGRAARLYNPRPANLRLSDKNDEYIGLIVRIGGAAMARSEFMPPWSAELTEEQMRDVVVYVRSINVSNTSENNR